MSARAPITFTPDGAVVWVASGTTVSEAAEAAGIVIPAPCGGRGVCGSCGVKVVSGVLADPDGPELEGLTRAPKGVRLACRARVVAPVEVRPLLINSRTNTGTAQTLTPQRALVAAVDLGTTSVAAVLIDAQNGRVLARTSVPNRQQSHGADVLSRVAAAQAGAGEALRAAAETSILEALRAAASVAGVSLTWVRRLVVAGNSAMSGLLCGSDLSGLATHPFTAPVFDSELRAPRLSTELDTDACVTVLAPIASFVGGDTVGAIIGSGILREPGSALLIDLGTNAEIVLALDGEITVASAAAGPAFEGAGITCGGPAAPGAITRVSVTAGLEIEFEVLGGGEPQWLSGSGVVSAVAMLRRLGHIDSTGLMLPEGPLQARFGRDAAGIVVCALGDGPGCLSLSQLDVREVQLAIAAIHVGIATVLHASTHSASELTAVFVAGALGFSLDTEDLISLGVLPQEASGIARRVGNAALDGAAAIAFDGGEFGSVAGVLRRATSVELALSAGFNDAFLAAMSLEPYSAS